MKKSLLFISICSASILCMKQAELCAQRSDTVWTLKLDGWGWPTQFQHLIQAQDNNFIAAGTYYTEDAQTDIWVVKFSEAGEILWNNTYQTDIVQPWIGESTTDIIEKSTGEIVVFAANDQYNHYLIFLDPDGNKTDLVNYIGPEDPYYVYCGINAGDNGFLVGGNHSVSIGNDWSHYSWYRKIDATGNILWEHEFPPVRWDDRFNFINKMPDGGFILAGSSDTPDNYDEVLLARISAQGDTLWTRRWGTSVFDYPEEIIPLPAGGYIMAATKSYIHSYKGMLVKLDDEGREQWVESYNDYDKDEIHSVKPTSDGGYIITGEYTPYDSDRPKFWIMKTNQQGSQVQSFYFGNEQDVYRGHCIIQTDNGGYIAVGTSQSSGIIVKVASDFGLFSINENQEPGFELHPNPTRGKFQITNSKHQTNSKLQIQNIELVDLYGKVINDIVCDFEFGACLVLGACDLEFDITRCPAGIYFIRISLENQIIVKKIIKY
jgi:hypothetical protein